MPGSFLLNGNAETADELVRAAAPLLRGQSGGDRRVVLVTAAWGAREHDEGHVKASLNELGLRSAMVDGYDRSLLNLSLWHEQQRVLEDEPELASAWAEHGALIHAARGFYLAHNAHLVALVRRAVADARQATEGPGLAELVSPGPRRPFGARPTLRDILGRELRHAIDTLEQNDDRLFELLRELDEGLFTATGLSYRATWRAARERLEARLLGADAIVLFGGDLDALLSGLRFFRLREPFAEAVRRGALVVAMSAGALALGERVIVFDDFAQQRSEFQLYDRGLGLVRELQLFPHCMDRIQTDDQDNLAYLAHRFRHRVCVGLNQRSLLLLEDEPPRATSWGEGDGVYVFGPTGDKRCYQRGERVPL